MKALRKCRKCGLEAHNKKELEAFSERADLPHGRATICSPCLLTQQNSNPNIKENKQRSRVKKCYKISLDEYKACMATSDKCLQCGAIDSLVYDHDHTTMKFRGVLCRRCNSSLGQLGDTLESIERMYIYLGGVPSKPS